MTVIYSESSIVTGFLNDNYTGSTENGENGNYIGADDFLTFSLFANYKNERFGFSEYYQVVTSRKYNYRFDLLLSTFYYNLEVSSYNLSPYFSLLLKGDFGGEYIQNEIHKIRDIPLLEQKYLDNELSPGFGIDIFRDFGLIIGRLNIDLPISIKPISGQLSLEYSLDLKYLYVDLVTGYKQYLTNDESYSNFVRSGLTFGGQLVIPVIKDATINAGCFFFPVKNLDNDPLYQDRDFTYSPQFWVTIGLNGEKFKVMDMVKF